MDSNPKSKYQKHPSILLNNLYKINNHQGANPNVAKILFIGRDPNWAFDIETMSMFNFVEEYLTDGVSFWKSHNVHHPFLLPGYKGDGKRYHRMFSKLKLDNSYSSEISFLELIGFPTTGMAKKDNKSFINHLTSDSNRNHLIRLDNLINKPDKVIFIAWGLMDDFKFLYRQTGLFSKFAKLDKSTMNISDLNQFENIYIHRHFSDCISNKTIDKMAKKVIHHLQ
jgi:hypothetical protein